MGHLDRLISAQMDRLFTDLAPGVEGLAIQFDGVFELGGIRAIREGDGSVGRYLDGLPRDLTVIVPYVTSSRLAGMLERRGFRNQRRYDPTIGVMDDACWIRKATR